MKKIQNHNTPFDVYETKVVRDDDGIERENHLLKYHLYGSVKFSFGREYELARQEGHHKQATIRTYYGATITPDMMIVLDGERYNIENVENIRLEDRELEIKIYQKQYE